MRLSVTALTVITACAAVWAQASGPATAPAPGSYRSDDLDTRMRAGLRARLADDARLGAAPTLTDLVVGSAPDAGGLSFRARTIDASGDAFAVARPVYGRAEARCDVGLERADCWRVTLLEIDGEAAR